MRECNTKQMLEASPVTIQIYDEGTGQIEERKINMDVLINRLDDITETYMKIGKYKVLGEFFKGIIWTFRVSTAATDGIRIYFNPLFANKLLSLCGPAASAKRDELIKKGVDIRNKKNGFDMLFETSKCFLFVLIHECYHQLYRHIESEKHKDETRNAPPSIHDLANVCQDIEINRDIEIQFPEFAGCTKMSEGQWEAEKYPNEIWSEIFDDKYANGETVMPPPVMAQPPGQDGPEQQGEDDPRHMQAPEDYKKGWDQALADIKAGKIDPNTFKKLNVNPENFDHKVLNAYGLSESRRLLEFNRDEFNQGYNDCIQTWLNAQQGGGGGGPKGPTFDNLEEPPMQGGGKGKDQNNDSKSGDNQQQGQGSGSGSSSQQDNSDIDNMSGEQAAQAAQQAANQAQQSADAAQQKAQQSGSKSDQQAANSAQQAANEAQKAADAASSAASSGDEQTARDKAKEARNAAGKASDAAQQQDGQNGSGSGSGQQNVDNMSGQEAANAAQQAANQAQQAADNAKQKAQQSGSGADKSAADAAQQSANEAQSAANQAQQAAANGDDDQARQKAKEAQAAAEKAKGAAGGKPGQNGQQNQQQGQGHRGEDQGKYNERTSQDGTEKGSKNNIEGNLSDAPVHVSVGEKWGGSDVISKEQGMEISQQEGNPFSTDEINQTPEQHAKSVIAKNEKEIKDIGKGTSMPMDRKLAKINEILSPSIINWKNLLAKLFKNAGIKEEELFKMKKSRMGGGFSRADRYEKVNPRNDVLPSMNSADVFYLIDNSGSISARDLYRTFSEVLALECRKDMNIRKSALTYFSDDIDESKIRVWYRDDSKKKKMELMQQNGDICGGTQIAKSVVHVTQLKKQFYSRVNPRTLIIVFTDAIDYDWEGVANLPEDIKRRLIFIVLNGPGSGWGFDTVIPNILNAGISEKNIVPIDVTKDLKD